MKWTLSIPCIELLFTHGFILGRRKEVDDFFFRPKNKTVSVLIHNGRNTIRADCPLCNYFWRILSAIGFNFYRQSISRF